MVTVDGERMIDADAVTHSDPDGLAPVPIGMSNKRVGGDAMGYSSGPPPTGQMGIIGKIGLNNIGLLVKTWGRVTLVDGSPTPAFVKITDGFGEIVVDLAPGATIPSVGDKVSVIGISSCYAVGDDLYSKIKLRSSIDLIIQSAL